MDTGAAPRTVDGLLVSGFIGATDSHTRPGAGIFPAEVIWPMTLALAQPAHPKPTWEDGI